MLRERHWQPLQAGFLQDLALDGSFSASHERWPVLASCVNCGVNYGVNHDVNYWLNCAVDCWVDRGVACLVEPASSTTLMQQVSQLAALTPVYHSWQPSHPCIAVGSRYTRLWNQSLFEASMASSDVCLAKQTDGKGAIFGRCHTPLCRHCQLGKLSIH